MMRSIRVPVWTTYVPADEMEAMHRNEVASFVNAVFERLVANGAPYNPDTIDHGDYGTDIEPLRESLTLFLTAWGNLMSVYTSTESDALIEFPERRIPAWKVWLVTQLFRKANPSSAKVIYRPEK
jgi:hypothetical protein